MTMKSPLYGVVTGTDEDGSVRHASRTATGIMRTEIATRDCTLALEVEENGTYRVLFSPNTWQRAQEEETWRVISSGKVGGNSLEVNNA